MKELPNLPLKDNIVAAVGNARPLMDSYIKDSQAMVALAFDNTAEFEAQFPRFMESFGKLEKAMAALSELIEKETTEMLRLAA